MGLFQIKLILGGLQRGELSEIVNKFISLKYVIMWSTFSKSNMTLNVFGENSKLKLIGP